MVTINLNIAFMAAFCFLVIFAVLGDVSRLKIPNWISLALIALFFVYIAIGSNQLSVVQHLAVAAIVFALGTFLFFIGWMGGGDVKLAAALALWAGPTKIIPFLFFTSVAGAALGAVIICGSFYLDWDGSGEAKSFVSRLFPRWVRHGLTPYGFAIGTGALTTIPALFY